MSRQWRERAGAWKVEEERVDGGRKRGWTVEEKCISLVIGAFVPKQRGATDH